MENESFVKVCFVGWVYPWDGARARARLFVKVKYQAGAVPDDVGQLSIFGVVGPLPSGNCRGSCGQIWDWLAEVNEYAPHWDRFKASALADIWRAFHLNDMKAGCEHQRALGWEKRRLNEDLPPRQNNLARWHRPTEHLRGVLTKPCPICGYRFGSKWQAVAVPGWALEYLANLPESDVMPAWV